MEKKDKLKVQMLGGFSMELNGVRLQSNFRDNSSFMLLLQTFLHFRKTGVERNTLIKTLFGDQELDDVSHSLRNSLYQAKKKLKELGMPDIEYFRKEKNVYYWTDHFDVQEDAEIFEHSFYKATQAKDPEERLQKMIRAAELYTGPFIPLMQNVPWVYSEMIRLRGLFERNMWEIDRFSTMMSKYSDLQKAALYAVNVDPYANWEALVLKALVGMDLYDDAERYYARTVDAYTAKFGSRTAKKVRDVVDALGRYMMYQQEDIVGIRERLRIHEDMTRGGFYCSFPVFQELYRSVERVMNRFGGYIYLMLCTISDAEGKPVEDSELLEPLSERLLESLVRSVRHSDTITRYGKGQFLILLFGTNEENCSIVKDRINADFARTLAEDEELEENASVMYSLSRVIVEQTQGFNFFGQLDHVQNTTQLE